MAKKKKSTMIYMILTVTYSEIAENKKAKKSINLFLEAKQKNLHQQKKPKFNIQCIYMC